MTSDRNPHHPDGIPNFQIFKKYQKNSISYNLLYFDKLFVFICSIASEKYLIKEIISFFT